MVGDIVDDLQLPGDFSEVLDQAKIMASNDSRQDVSKLKVISVQFVVLDEETDMVYSPSISVPGYSPASILPMVKDELHIGLCWYVLGRTMESVQDVMASKSIDYVGQMVYVDNFAEEGWQGIKQIIAIKVTTPLSKDEVMSLIEAIQSKINSGIDALAAEQISSEDVTLAKIIARTIEVRVEVVKDGSGPEPEPEES